eukprot:529010_1
MWSSTQSTILSLLFLTSYAIDSGLEFDAFSAETFGNTSVEMRWIKIMSCKAGTNSNTYFKYYYTNNAIKELAEGAHSIKFAPPVESSEYDDYVVMAKPFTPPIFALNNYKALSYAIDEELRGIANADTSYWVGKESALTRLTNSGFNHGIQPDFDVEIYHAYNNFDGLHITLKDYGANQREQQCVWDWNGPYGPDIEIYFGYIPSLSVPYSIYDGYLCSNEHMKYDIRYNVTLDNCISSCARMSVTDTECELFSYNRRDSQCYLFDKLCEIQKADETNVSVVGYRTGFEVAECIDTFYTDDFTCEYYESRGLCDDKDVPLVETCCACGGGLTIFDNVALSSDIDWLCPWNDSIISTNWSNLVLHNLCDSLDDIDCDYLFNQKISISNDYNLYLCNMDQQNHSELNFAFHVIIASNPDNFIVIDTYVNTLWFDLDLEHYSQHINIDFLNYTQCLDQILERNDSDHYGINVCGLHEDNDIDDETDEQNEQGNDMDIAEIFSIILAALLLIAICVVVFLCCKKNEETHVSTHEEESWQDEFELESINNKMDGIGECEICMERPKVYAFVKCGHLVCPQCASKLWKTNNKICPFCKQKILSVIKLYGLNDTYRQKYIE